MGQFSRKVFLKRTLLGSLGAGAYLADLDGSALAAEQDNSARDRSYVNKLPIAGQYDVIVAGGGLAGVAAACAAARAGASTALIEAQAFAGGVATATMEATMSNRFHNAAGEQVVGGRPYELVERLVDLGATTATWAKQPYHITFDIELAKLAMDMMLEEAGVHVYYGTIVTDAVTSENRVTGVVISNRSGNQRLKATCVVDSTGDADVAYYAGVPLRAARMSNSFMFRLGNVDFERLVAFFRENPEEYGNARSGARSIDRMLAFHKAGYFILEHYGNKLKKTVRDAIERGEYSETWGPFHHNARLQDVGHLRGKDAQCEYRHGPAGRRRWKRAIGPHASWKGHGAPRGWIPAETSAWMREQLCRAHKLSFPRTSSSLMIQDLRDSLLEGESATIHPH